MGFQGSTCGGSESLQSSAGGAHVMGMQRSARWEASRERARVEAVKHGDLGLGLLQARVLRDGQPKQLLPATQPVPLALAHLQGFVTTRHMSTMRGSALKTKFLLSCIHCIEHAIPTSYHLPNCMHSSAWEAETAELLLQVKHASCADRTE